MRFVGFVMCYQPIVFSYKVDEMFCNYVGNLANCGIVIVTEPKGVSEIFFDGRYEHKRI